LQILSFPATCKRHAYLQLPRGLQALLRQRRFLLVRSGQLVLQRLRSRLQRRKLQGRAGRARGVCAGEAGRLEKARHAAANCGSGSTGSSSSGCSSRMPTCALCTAACLPSSTARSSVSFSSRSSDASLSSCAQRTCGGSSQAHQGLAGRVGLGHSQLVCRWRTTGWLNLEHASCAA